MALENALMKLPKHGHRQIPLELVDENAALAASVSTEAEVDDDTEKGNS